MDRPPYRRSLRVDRRSLLALGGATIGGWVLGRVVVRTAPVGRDLDVSGAAADILDDPAAPGIGPVAASLRLAAFSDYRCPACRHGYPALIEAVTADGDVRLLFKDWPIFGAASVRAARVALASVGQGIYPGVHHRLMTGAARLDDAALRGAVIGAGGDWPDVLRALSVRRAAIDAQVRRHAAEAAAIGLPGTPGYLAGARLAVGVIDAAAFGRLFAEARDRRSS